MKNKKITSEQKLRHEIKQWKETCEIVSDRNIMKSIQISLNQIAQGKGIPLAQL
jgi:hypothetical protein